jgi:hypothetical protein
MAGTYDSEQQRISDRIKCIAFREARDAGATFINRQWIAEKIHRSTRFVTEWWEKSYDDCFTNYSDCGRKLKSSDASQNLILSATGKKKEALILWSKRLQQNTKSTLLQKQSIISVIGRD